jgi:hypothetical protein
MSYSNSNEFAPSMFSDSRLEDVLLTAFDESFIPEIKASITSKLSKVGSLYMSKKPLAAILAEVEKVYPVLSMSDKKQILAAKKYFNQQTFYKDNVQDTENRQLTVSAKDEQKLQLANQYLANHFASFKESHEDQPIYISDTSYLKYPMISDNGKKITFSSKSFKMFLGSYIPSILSTPIVIKLLNIKENKIRGFIRNYNMNGITVGEIDNENTLKIYIDIQNIKPQNSLYTKIIQFQLEINSEGYKKVIIPFELSLNIVPLSIIFSSLDYKLIYNSEKNAFIFNSDIVYSNSDIKFSFHYLYNSKKENQLNNNIVDFEISLESL